MDIILEDMTWKAKRKLLKTILKGIEEFDAQCMDEEITDYILLPLLDMLDQSDCEDAWGTEGWQHAFGVSS
jgi:hypothetical protein